MTRTILLVAGARPNFVKVAPLMPALAEFPDMRTVLVHTGQHYGAEMSDSFFRDLSIPEPEIHLGVGSGSHADQTARIMVEFERVVEERKPDLVVVVGDVNSTLGCSLVAAKASVPLAHVEAGLRSFDRSMPEEINRLVTDCLATILFTTSQDADEHLLAEGHGADQIHFVGNTMIDTLLRHRETVAARPPPGELPSGVRDYALVTLHRPANVDDPDNLRGILEALSGLSLPVVFPMHPRTRAVAESAGMSDLLRTLHVIAPVGYLDFLCLQMHARIVLTDSGGIQEETTVLGVPCLTFRDNTERPITVSHGTNRLIGTNPDRIAFEVAATLASPPPAGRIPPLWDGHAADRIAEVLAQAMR